MPWILSLLSAIKTISSACDCSQIIISKRADIKKISFGIFFVLIIYMLFFSVLPGNEKVLPFAFGADECVPGNGDSDSTMCSAYGGCNGGPGWGIGGETNITSGQCCGDDSLAEWVRTRNCASGSGCTSSATDDACCAASTKCVYNSVCYSSGSNYCAPYNSNLRVSCSAGQWGLVEDCSTKTSTDSDGGDAPGTAGTVTDYSTCASGSSCNSVTYPDSCASSTQLTEYYPSGSTYVAKTYTCSGTYSRETAASDADGGDNPASNGVCTGGQGATCSSGAFTQTAGASGTDGCVGSCATGSCVYREWYPADSADACPGLDNCISKDYNPDTNSNTCTTCGQTWLTDDALCCGDDLNENVRTREVDNSVMENGFSSSILDDGCCTTGTSCVVNSVCYPDDSSIFDADGDGDLDYCDAGTWKDCKTTSDCQLGRVCSPTLNDCVDAMGYVLIKNLGVTGIESSNQEYTSQRTVLLLLNYTKDALTCRYINHDNPLTEPPVTASWTPWETCITNKLWELTESPGLKIVYYQVDYGDTYENFSDSIFYNYTGAGLDMTPPSQPVIVYPAYTNKNTSLDFSWYNATDPESDILRIPLYYMAVLYDSLGATLLGQDYISGQSHTFGGLSLAHNTKVFLNISAVNSAGLKSNATTSPQGTIIDLEDPYILWIRGSFTNVSDKKDYSLPSTPSWVYASAIKLNWSGYDSLSGETVEYSYLLTKDPASIPDEVPEGITGRLDEEKNKTYFSVGSGKFLFKVRTKDIAGNWGDPLEFEIWIDITPPSRPQIVSQNSSLNSTTYRWSESIDHESGVNAYMINLTDENGVLVNSTLITEIGTREHTFSNLATGNYNATIGAKNGVGIWRWSTQGDYYADFKPPEIRAYPNITVISNSPLIKAFTDEQAVCDYNGTRFLYTNTTYHEAKLNSLANGHYRYDIRCIDLSENENTISMNFTIDNTRSPAAMTDYTDIEAYPGKLVFLSIYIADPSVLLAGNAIGTFTLSLDSEEKEISVFDFGTGSYMITFYAPEEEKEYAARLYAGSMYDDFTLRATGLKLSAIYHDDDIASVPANTRHITHAGLGSSKIGIATASDVDLSLYAPLQNTLNISNADAGTGIMVFNTLASASMNDRNKRISSGSFEKSINPSFGFAIEEQYFLRLILYYENYLLANSLGNKISRGQNNLIIQRIASDDKATIKFIKSGRQQDRVVLTG